MNVHVYETMKGFDICVDMYTENTNASIYEGMARAILARGTGRVLTFHADGPSVWNFVNLHAFTTAFRKIQTSEVSAQAKITFEGMDGSTPAFERERLLQQLDDTSNEDIFILSSCDESVDTKRANMYVFADPKVKSIQNVIRKDTGSTIFIPCYVNMENYASANGPEEVDHLIQEKMRATNGDYAPILNVVEALKQDEALYKHCWDQRGNLYWNLNYHSKWQWLEDRGFTIEVGDEDAIYKEGYVEWMKNKGVPLEIHTHDDTIEQRFNEDNIGRKVKMVFEWGEHWKTETLTRLYYYEEDHEYCRICTTDGEVDDGRVIIEPEQKKHVGLSIHQNNDILMLWGVKGERDFVDKFKSLNNGEQRLNVHRFALNLNYNVLRVMGGLTFAN